MALVNWEWTLLVAAPAGSSHRVARRGASAFSPPNVPTPSGVQTAGGTPATWSPKNESEPPLALTDANGNRYVFAFWSIRGGTTDGKPVASTVVATRKSFSVGVGGDDNSRATAYFVPDFGGGGPGGGGFNAIQLDAFDEDTGFIADDFVNVFPEDGLPHGDVNSLHWKANDGLLNSDSDFAVDEKITAFDPPGREFVTWIEIEALTAPAQNGPSVSNRDVVVKPHSRLVAFAVYRRLARRFPDLSGYAVWDPWWWIATHGGLTPPGPVDPLGPWIRQLMAAISMVDAAARAPASARSTILRVAREQVSAASEAIEREIEKISERRR